eukprot:CAMPEP_0172389410 /NCGR_PEP_ID=MMETSP1061-20121228/6304_1 /TAXON_ID=37318 /ORGANISM="Pseudo-nitzschia pungens, Strain cf. pungens" /LENGTH=273 /DNA_ID=CAMNT_0013119553 /DNA_START=103 /DNA_END=924 /DNA_ORIENTATION=-
MATTIPIPTMTMPQPATNSEPNHNKHKHEHEHKHEHNNDNDNDNDSGGTFEQYLALAEKALRKSRESLDTRALIKLAYGDDNDTAHIGGTDMLEGILDGVLDTIAHEAVLSELRRYGTTARVVEMEEEERESDGDIGNERKNRPAGQPPQNRTTTPMNRLATIDAAVAGVTAWEERRQTIERADAFSARDMLQKNLPMGVLSAADVVAYREHLEKLRVQSALENELQELLTTIDSLEQEREARGETVREQLGNVERAENELEAAADVCAMVTT